MASTTYFVKTLIISILKKLISLQFLYNISTVADRVQNGGKKDTDGNLYNLRS